MLEKNISSFFFCFLICQKVIIFFLPTLLRFDENLKKKAYGNSAKEQIIAWNIWTHAVICGGSLNFNVYVFSREILEARPWRKGGPVWMPRSIPWPASWLIWSAALPISLGPHRWVLSTTLVRSSHGLHSIGKMKCVLEPFILFSNSWKPVVQDAPHPRIWQELIVYHKSQLSGTLSQTHPL